jgi:hypothetical protein
MFCPITPSAGCVPVLINDHVEPIFHGILDWDTFSVRVPQVGWLLNRWAR